MAAKRRGRPVDRTGDETRASILATATRLFGEAGYLGVSMDRLAAECGLTVRALYHYFPSKRALFDAATAAGLERFADEVATRVLVHQHVRDRLDGYLDVYRTLLRDDPHLVAFIGTVLAEAAARPTAAAPEVDAGAALRGFLERLVDDAIAAGEVAPDLDREGAVTLLAAIGRGLSLTALADPDHVESSLDALGMLVAGSLFK